jgi:hypothetical protein
MASVSFPSLFEKDSYRPYPVMDEARMSLIYITLEPVAGWATDKIMRGSGYGLRFGFASWARYTPQPRA